MATKKLTCTICGCDFAGAKAFFCPDCRKTRMKIRAKKNMAAMRAGYAKHVNSKSQKLEKKITDLLKLRQKEPFVKIERCPNFKQDYMGCVTCPAGAWKFKACGRKQ